MASPSTATAPKVDLVIPVLNEAKALEKSVRTVREFLGRTFPYPWQVTVADNGSTDGTFEIAQRLARECADVHCFRLEQRGRGRALRHAWTRSDADILAYTDVDLSTELEALEKLCRGIHEGGYDLGTGSRLLPQSQVTRGAKREFISRCYNVFVKCVLFTHYSDAQCGFKAVSKRVVRDIVPQVKDEAWFFDTELLTLAEKQGYRILDVPVRWIDDDDSRVKIVSTAWEDIKGVMRVRRYLWSREAKARSQGALEPSGEPRR
jgi:glycosyltransferase involved in cell wall biosynthesis